MLRFWAVLRRAMLIGVISLAVSVFAMHVNLMDIVGVAWPISSMYSAILLFFLISPVLYLVFLIISTFLIRRFGQFASTHREKPYIVTLIICLWSDITSPFRAIINFVTTIFGGMPDSYSMLPEAYAEYYWNGSKRVYTIRLIMMLVFFALCFFGVQIILWNT